LDLSGYAICEEVRVGVMRIVLVFAAVAEIVTGLALLIVPSLVGQLLLNEELADIAIPVARVTGLALIGLGLACWPGPPILGMLVYSTLVMLYLAYIGFVGDFVGVFLWPAVLFHAGLSILLAAYGWPQRRRKA
jgi:hypothetical protein